MSFINDYIKPSDFGAVRKDINRILSLIHDIVAQEPEDEGLQERIMVTPHVKLRTSTVDWNLVDLYSEIREKTPALFRRVISSITTIAHGLTPTTNGTWTFPQSNTKFGGSGTVDGSTNLELTYNSKLVPSKFTVSGWFYLPATDASDVSEETLINAGSYQLSISPHGVAANQINAVVVISSGTGNIETETPLDLQTEALVTLELDNQTLPYKVSGTFTGDAWNHIVMTFEDASLKLYIDKVLQGTNTSATGTVYDPQNNIIIG